MGGGGREGGREKGNGRENVVGERKGGGRENG